MSTKKYEIVKTDNIVHDGKTLYRIRALKDFVNVFGEQIRKGELGGYIESENNLSQKGTCWISDNAKVFSNATVCDNATICANAIICDNATICANATVSGSAKVYGNAKVYDEAEVCGNAKVYDKAGVYDEARVFGEAAIFGNALIFGGAKVYDKARVFDDAQIYGNAWLYGVAKIGDGLNLNKGEYIFKSLNVEETLNEIKPICEKVDFVNKAIKSNFPVEESYIENLISQFAEYSELLANFLYEEYDEYIDIFSEGIEIYELLLQGKANVEMLKNKTKGEEI